MKAHEDRSEASRIPEVSQAPANGQGGLGLYHKVADPALACIGKLLGGPLQDPFEAREALFRTCKEVTGAQPEFPDARNRVFYRWICLIVQNRLRKTLFHESETSDAALEVAG
jgi:hypothetical protein